MMRTSLERKPRTDSQFAHRCYQLCPWITALVIGFFLATPNVVPAQQTTRSIGDSLPDQFRLAAGFYQRRQWQEACTAFQAIIDTATDSTEAHRSRFYLGEAFVQLMDYEQAFKAFDAYLVAQPDPPLQKRAEFRRAEAAFYTKNDAIGAGLLKDFARDYPDDPLLEFCQSYLGEALLRTERFEEAAAVLESCLAGFPESGRAARNQLNLAHCYRLAGHTQKSLDILAAYAQRSAESAWTAHLARGHLQFATGDFRSAESDYRAALQQIALAQDLRAHHPTEIGQCKYWLARCLMEQKNWNAAAEFLLPLAESDRLPAELRAKSAHDAAICFVQLKDFAAAHHQLETICTDFNDSPLCQQAICLRVELASSQQQSELVLELTRQFQFESTESKLGYQFEHHRAIANYQLGEFAECRQACEKLLSANEAEVAELHRHKALWAYLAAASCIGLNDFQQADRYLNMFSKLPQESQQEWHQHLLLAKAAVDSALDRNTQVIGSLSEFLRLTKSSEQSSPNRSTALSATIPAIPASSQTHPKATEGHGLQRVVQRNLVVALCREQRLVEADELLATVWSEPGRQAADLLIAIQLAQTAARVARAAGEKDAAAERGADVAAIASKWFARASDDALDRRKSQTASADQSNDDEISFRHRGLLTDWFRHAVDLEDWVQATDVVGRLLRTMPAEEITAGLSIELAEQFLKTGNAAQACRLMGQFDQVDSSHALQGRLALVHSRAVLAEAKKSKEAANTGQETVDSDTHLVHKARQILATYVGTADDLSRPDQDLVRYELAWLELNEGNTARALAHFESVDRHFPESKVRQDALLRMALIYTQQQRFERAARAARLLIETAAEGSCTVDHGYLLRGRSLYELEKYPAARHALAMCFGRTERDDYRSSAAAWLCRCIANSADAAEAIREFRQRQEGLAPAAAKLVPQMELQIAQQLAELGKLELAGQTAEETLAKFEDFELRYELDYIVGRALASRGEFTQARERYQRVTESTNGGSSPTAAMSQWMIGESFLHQERYAEAIDAYYRVDSLYDYPQWQALALVQAGKCHEQLGNGSTAAKLYRRVLELDPDSKAAEDAGSRLAQIDN